MGAPHVDRWRLALPLAVPALGGLAYLAAFGAPARLIAVNAGALVLAMALVLWGRLPSRPELRERIAAGAAVMLFVPLLTGPELGGVSRWLPLGPVSLHSGALLLPLIVVIAASAPQFGPLLLAAAGAGLAIQPDAASLGAYVAACAVLAVLRRDPVLASLAALASVHAVSTFDEGKLAPQLYTEGVLAHVAQTSLPAAVALGLLLFAAPLLILAARSPRAESAALAALLAGFGAMAMLGPFPFPLIGHGAAPILGFGLALGALGRLPPGPASR
ncbi:hypothetical protein ACLBKU_11035 [Erythrobacter sp. NE805]|uniref:hypothetical protein n=1 Tax=Erythrobacter sp. NE805 TaxID=3389875 RepID=UPI00396B0614